MDKAGRRTLTLTGLGGMCLCAVAMTVGLKFQVCPIKTQRFILSVAIYKLSFDEQLWLPDVNWDGLHFISVTL